MSKIVEIQKILGVVPDGIFGPKSRAALEALIAGEAAPAHETEFDERTEKNLRTLNGGTQALMRAFMRKLIPYMAARGVVAKIIGGSRTFAEQDALYAQGRTAPGPRVTNARGGQSNHNFKCAADIGLFRGADYLEDSPLYREAGPLGKSVGLQWGGDWTKKDYPHYEAKQFRES